VLAVFSSLFAEFLCFFAMRTLHIPGWQTNIIYNEDMKSCDLLRFAALYLKIFVCYLGCRGKQKVSLSIAFRLLKIRILPRFAAICRPQNFVNKM
jgi:hypothetical protein